MHPWRPTWNNKMFGNGEKNVLINQPICLVWNKKMFSDVETIMSLWAPIGSMKNNGYVWFKVLN